MHFTRLICVSLICVYSLLLSVSASEVHSFDNCLKYEVNLYEKLFEAKYQGGDVAEALDSIAPDTLSDRDRELMLYFVRTREPEAIAKAIAFRCALDYPDSSPFSQEQIRELRNVEREGIKELVIRNTRENDTQTIAGNNTSSSPEVSMDKYISDVISMNLLDGALIVLFSFVFKKRWLRISAVGILGAALGVSHAMFPQGEALHVGYIEGVMQSVLMLFLMLTMITWGRSLIKGNR